MQIQVFLSEKAPRLRSEQIRVALSVVRSMRERGIYTLLTLIPNSYSIAGKRHTTYWLDKRAERIFNYITKWIRNVSKQAIIRALILFYTLTRGRNKNGEELFLNAYSQWEHELQNFIKHNSSHNSLFLLTSPFVAVPVFGIARNTIVIPIRRADPDLFPNINPISDNAIYWIGNWPWLHRRQLFYLVFFKERKAVLRAIPVEFKYMRLMEFLACGNFSKRYCARLQKATNTYLRAEDFANATQTIVKLLAKKTLIKRGETALLIGQAWLPDPKAWLRWEAHILKRYAEDIANKWMKGHYWPMKLLYKAEIPSQAVDLICTNQKCKKIMHHYLSLYTSLYSNGKYRIVAPWELPRKLRRRIYNGEKGEEAENRKRFPKRFKRKLEEFSLGLEMLKKELQRYRKRKD